VACVGEKTNAHTVFIEKPERKRLVGRTRHTSEDNVKTYVKEKTLEGVEWIRVAWDRDKVWKVVTTVMNAWNFSSI
jgi:hypothetical protein